MVRKIKIINSIKFWFLYYQFKRNLYKLKNKYNAVTQEKIDWYLNESKKQWKEKQ